jgi:hypothetical protein
VISDFHVDTGGGVKQDINARAKFDEAHALATLEAVSDLGIENDPPGQKARDLFKNDRLALALHGNDVLLVLIGGGGVHGV